MVNIMDDENALYRNNLLNDDIVENDGVLAAAKIDTSNLDGFDFDKIRSEILSLSSESFVSALAKGNQKWNGMSLVGPNGMHAWHLGLGGNFIDTPVLEHLPCTKAFLHSFPLKLQSVRISTLGAKGLIVPHRDHDLHGGLLRLHLAIKTNNDIDFRIGDQKIVMNEGELWYGNFGITHTVRNDGDEERVHLLIDGYARKEAYRILSKKDNLFGRYLKSASIDDDHKIEKLLINRYFILYLKDKDSLMKLYCKLYNNNTGIGIKLIGTPMFVSDIVPYKDNGFVACGTPFKFSSSSKGGFLNVDFDEEYAKRLDAITNQNTQETLSRSSEYHISMEETKFGKYELIKHSARQYLAYIFIAHISMHMDAIRKKGVIGFIRGLLQNSPLRFRPNEQP